MMCWICNKVAVSSAKGICPHCQKRTKRGIRRDYKFIPDGAETYVPLTKAYEEYLHTPKSLRAVRFKK